MKRELLVLCTMALTAGCGGDSPAGPSPTAPRVTSIAPASGPASGGTAVTIGGSNFSGSAVVSIGGAAASSVTVVSATTITAVTGARSAGPADVVVTLGGGSATLPSAFTYVAGQPPVIQSITAQGTRTREPARFADLNEEIQVSATATDADTPAGDLTYAWSAPAGTFSSATGARVRWRAPQSFDTPGTVTLTLRVGDGGSQVTGTVVVRVHDSVNEVGDMARTFLEDFSRQERSPEDVVRNFADGCSGKAAELLDVRNNQRTFEILSWSVGDPDVTVRFGGVCQHRNRAGDACARLEVDWRSRCINETRLNGDKVCDLGQTSRATGVDQVAARYLSGRWWLCNSDFIGSTTDTVTGKTLPSFKH
jgi:hypothetical protein